MGRRLHPSTTPRAPTFLKGSPSVAQVSAFISTHANFYRVHLLAFIFVPLLFSGIFYASNGENHIRYIDALFMVTSCATVTGLNSVLLADLTLWQQVILFFMMCLGSTSSISVFTIMIRKHFFRRKFDYMIATSSEARHRINQVGAEETAKRAFHLNSFSHDPVHHPTMMVPSPAAASRSSTPSPSTPDVSTPLSSSIALGLNQKKKKKKKVEKLRVDMVRRANLEGDQAHVEGWLEREKEAERRENGLPMVASVLTEEPLDESAIAEEEEEEGRGRRSAVREGEHAKASIHIDDSSKPHRDAPSSPRFRRQSLPGIKTHHHQHHPVKAPVSPKHFPRSKTVEWGDDDSTPDSRLRLRRQRTNAIDPDFPRRRNSNPNLHDPHSRAFTRTTTYQPDTAMSTGYGGFPNPLAAAATFVRRQLPAAVERNMTMPRTTTLASTKSGPAGRMDAATKPVSYFTFDATVGRNSKFRRLTTAQQEELGGVEYRALTILLRIVVGYWLLLQLIGVLLIAPWLSGSATYAPVFAAPDTNVNPAWFSFFQVFSAFSNTGMSLVDASMVPFQKAYLLIVVMSFLILGGNTAFPVFLRLLIWTISKIVPSQSRTRETLQFLLDHPRRCFIYLFPSHQTWFLVFVLVVLNSIDWVSFLVLDIGNPVIEAIPVGTRVIDGLFQAFAVRAAGFAIVTLADTAPALQLLYLIMMYIAVYPIAVSIRSTNVYEEKSMGVFEEDDEEDEDEVEARLDKTASPTSYIAYHARKQLAFDMWWLVLAVWIICIIERTNIIDDSAPWITVFSIMFEVCSAYGTVGLSLGTPTKNTSLAGALRPLSRLVLIAVMIRGRHRGLPIAIDRAVLLPSDLVNHNDDAASSFVGGEAEDAAGGRREMVEEDRLARVKSQTDLERVQEMRAMEGEEEDRGEGHSERVDGEGR